MKIFVNRKIKLLFGSILLCICFFMLASALLIGFGVRNAAAFMMICFLLMSAAILALQDKRMNKQIVNITSFC